MPERHVCQSGIDIPAGAAYKPSFNHPLPPKDPPCAENAFPEGVANGELAAEAKALDAEFLRAFHPGLWRYDTLPALDAAVKARAEKFAIRAERLLVPCDTDTAARLVLPVLQGRHHRRVTPDEIKAMATTWGLTLRRYPAWAVGEAVTTWDRQNKRGMKPVLGEVESLCVRLLQPVQAVARRCARAKLAPLADNGRGAAA